MVTLRPISRATPASTAESGTRLCQMWRPSPCVGAPVGGCCQTARRPLRFAPLRGLRAGRTPVSPGSRANSLEAGSVAPDWTRPWRSSLPGVAIQCRDSGPLSRLRRSSLGMPRGIVRQRADDLEAVPFIERRSLEGVRFQRKLHTAACLCLHLSCLQQPTADAPPARMSSRTQSASIQQLPPQLQPYTPATSSPWLSVSTVRSSRKSRMPVASTLNSLISSIKRRAVARSASLKMSLLRSSVITVALSLPVQQHGRIDLATDDQPAVRRAALNT